MNQQKLQNTNSVLLFIKLLIDMHKSFHIHQKASYKQIYLNKALISLLFFPVAIVIDDAASLLCVAAGFVKNAAELQFKIRELYRHISNDCYCFFLRLLAFDFSGFHQAYVVLLLPIPVIALL